MVADRTSIKRFTHVYHLWNRDNISRTDAVHFFIEKAQVYEDDRIKCKLRNVYELHRYGLISQIVKYYIVKIYMAMNMNLILRG